MELAMQLGVAAAIAWGAKHEMAEFRKMFKETLDKLTNRAEATDIHVAKLGLRMDQAEEALDDAADVVRAVVTDMRKLAKVVEQLVPDDEDEPTKPEAKVGFAFAEKPAVAG